MFSIEQIIAILIVYLKVGNVDIVLNELLSPSDFIEEMCKNSWYDSPLTPCVPSTHSVSLTRSGLPIGEYRSVVAIKATIKGSMD